MKLVCLNLAMKINNSDRIIDFLLTQNADIVCLQEVANHKEESVHDTFKSKYLLDKALKDKYPYQHFSPLWQAPGYSKIDFGGYIEQGNYLLSKHKIEKSSTKFFHKSYIKTDNWTSMNFRTEDHGRAIQIVEIVLKEKTIRIMNIHGIWTKDKIDDKRTIAQSEFILEQINKKNIPTILAGDFNLLPSSESIKILTKKMKNLIVDSKYTSTRPDFDDELEIGGNIVDYIFINSEIICKKFEVLDINISDHRPLVLEFEI